MKLYIYFNIDNAAFADNMEGELTHVFGRITHEKTSGYEEGVVMDSQGNTVGKWEVGDDA